MLVEHNSFSQEEGGSVEKAPEEIIIQKDSSIVFEGGDVDHIMPSVNTPFNIPSTDSQKKANPTPIQLLPNGEKHSPESQPKVKESKQDFSFNIIYYLIYKFKQVDN